VSMPSFASDPAGFAEELARQATRMKERADRAERAMASASFTAASRDKSVTVTVNSAGALTGVEFGSKARALTRIQLAATVMETYAQATAEAGRRSREVLAELLGDRSETLGAFDAVLPPADPDPKRQR